MKNSFAGLAFSLGLWGCYYGITNTSISALLADSVEEGQRSHHLTTRQIAVKLGTALGPLVTLLMFTILGDSWNVRECSIVIIVGQIISVPGFILLWFISDDYIVVEDESSHGLDDTASVSESDYDSDETASEDAIYGTESDYDSFATPTTNYRAIAVLIAIADVTSGLGSGMSIRYFPIFFLDNLKMSPVLVQILYFISPLVQAGLAKLAQQGAKQIGRCQMTVACKWFGITCMVLMMSAYQINLPNYVISVLYVLRTSFMNCTQALTKSVIMDVVPKNERAKWSALESVNMFSWSGSAFVGGLLVDAEGILFNFYITAAFQFMATLPLIYLFRESAILEKPRQR
jgi:MFS family permease